MYVNTLARILSVVFHPLLMPTWLVLVLAGTFPWALQPARPDNLQAYVLMVAGLTFILPAINLVFLKGLGYISSFTLPEREQRIRPFLIILLLYSCCTFLFHYKLGMGLSDNFFRLLLILNMLVLVAWLLTCYIKLSIHSMAAAAIPVILAVLSRFTEEGQLFPVMLISIVLAGVVMSARLQLQAHTLQEVLLGAVAGAVTAGFTGILLF
jgi:membrane-associated phospholipid phosphatase